VTFYDTNSKKKIIKKRKSNGNLQKYAPERKGAERVLGDNQLAGSRLEGL